MAGKRNKIYFLLLLCVFVIALMTSCTGERVSQVAGERHVKIEGLEWQGREELKYATGFTIDNYSDGFRLITISGNSKYLIVPKDRAIPQGIENDICVINQPVSSIYMVATAVMDMFRALDAIDTIRLSGTDADGWYIEEARQALETGDMLYAGKYSAPDYELIISQECQLAIENMMITHTPEVKEQLEKLGVTVLVDAASNEQHPLGRVEWIKLYGVLLGKEDEAEQLFDEQVKALEDIQDMVSQGDTPNNEADKTVAFFYFTSNGAVSIRRPSDYIPKIIETVGGRYIFDDLEADDKKSSSMTMQMEEFYARAKSADYLIYNSSIDGEYKDLNQLLEKNSILQDFDAVRNNNVWCTTKNLYQESMSVGGLITDIYSILNDENPQTRYLYRLE